MIFNVKNYEVLIDDSDWDLIKNYKWFIANKKGTIYIQSFCKVNKKRVTYQLARVIMDAPSDMLVDHINGNTLDNRKINLRLANKRTNAQNMRPNKNTTSKYKGVCWSSNRNKWRANIFYKKQIYIGRFNLEKDAALAYNKSALQYFGEYARLNKIEEQ